MTKNEITHGHFGNSGIPKYLSDTPFNVQLIKISKTEIDDEEITTITIWDGLRELRMNTQNR